MTPTPHPRHRTHSMTRCRPDDQGEWATATTKKKKQPASQHRGGGGGYGSGPGGYANGRGMDDRRGGRGGVSEKMRGVSFFFQIFSFFLLVW